MIAVLLLLAAEPMTPIEAERAFAADAQKLGQWTAFRKYAADEGMMFVPQPTNAQEWLKDKKDPPVAVFWWPGRSYVSCDGTVAINTGPWVREWGKAIGYFTTVWTRQADGGWKWIYDAGDELKTARGEGGDIRPVVASCDGKPPTDRAVIVGAEANKSATDTSKDGTLRWWWSVAPNGGRVFYAEIWTGHHYEHVVRDEVAAPPE